MELPVTLTHWYYRCKTSGYINTDFGIIGVELPVTLTHWYYRCETSGYINTDIGIIGMELPVTITQTLVLSAWNFRLQ